MPYTARPMFVLAALVLVLCGACANTETNPDAPPPERSPADPLEPMNRFFYRGYMRIDRFTFKPLAKGYEAVIPSFMRRGVTNFSENLRAPLNIINLFLQGKFVGGFKQTGRFLMNTTFGIGGLIDVATNEGIDVQNEDFGQTLAVWGVPDGPYLFIPFMGPRTLRDATMIPLNFLADPLYHYKDASVRDKVYLIRAIDLRQRLLSRDQLIKGAYDPYIRIREAYFQNRKFEVYDGNPPEDEDPYEDFDDEFLEDE
jgi:phospholipid-binding lipoprotein MlaA